MTTSSPQTILFRHPAHLLALGLGSGLSPVAPGTVATLWAWVVFLMLDPFMTDAAWAVLLVSGLIIGARACTITGRALGEVDSGALVWDEILAFWLVLWLLPRASDPAGFLALGPVPEWLLQLAAFGLFRFFDILKPPPIRTIDRLSRDGWGVMWDDLVAAAYTLVVCAVGLRVAHLAQGWL
jgi:phosphatidylglycerophosphatase A